MTNTNKTEGARYQETRDLDITELAKCMRTDIAALKFEGKLPRGSKVSIRCQRYAGGQAIHVVVSVSFATRRTAEATERARALGQICPWLTRAACDAHDALQAIHDSYNYNNSDMMSDYFDYKFAGTVSVTSDAAEVDTLECETVEAPAATVLCLVTVPAKSAQLEMLESLGAL